MQYGHRSCCRRDYKMTPLQNPDSLNSPRAAFRFQVNPHTVRVLRSSPPGTAWLLYRSTLSTYPSEYVPFSDLSSDF